MQVTPKQASGQMVRWLAVGVAAVALLAFTNSPGSSEATAPSSVDGQSAPVAPQAVTDTAGWFPFPQLGSDSTDTVISAADLLLDAPGDDPATLIDRRGPVQVANGRFVFANTGERVRFWGVNLNSASAFPASPDFPPRPNEGGSVDDARELAARLAKLGFNAVRFHHLDNTFTDGSGTLWEDYTDNTQVMNPTQLGRLDYLIYQLKRNGIYVNLNLHVSRRFTPNDGVTAALEMANSDIDFNKNTTLFDPVQIGLQKVFAETLLNRVNPYTGMAYKDDPVIFSTETTNENSLYLGLGQDALNWYPGDPGSLPEFYDDQLDGWSDLGGPSTLNRLTNGDFADGLDGWFHFADAPAVATFSTDEGAVRLDIANPGTVREQMQLGQGVLAMQAGTSYEVSFRVRALEPTSVRVTAGRDAPPWDNFGLSEPFAVGTEWETRRATFTANTTSFGQARITFNLGAEQATTLWIDDVTFREASPLPGWHGWLRDRYGTTEAIRAAWAHPNPQPDTQKLANPSFEAGLANWSTNTFGSAAATVDVVGSDAVGPMFVTDGDRSLRADVTEVTAQSWQVQLFQTGLSLTEGQTYRLRFDARASEPGPIRVVTQRSVVPFDVLGLTQVFNLGNDWQTYEIRFIANDTTTTAFLGFLIGQSPRTIWIDNVSFGRSSPLGLADGESLEDNSIARMPRWSWQNYSDARIRDLITFYTELEADYFAEMQRFLDEEIGAQSLNTGTANYLDNLGHLPAMAATDYLDNHFYWDHPAWPNGDWFAPSGWEIDNEAWLNHAFEGLFNKAVQAVRGKPFTVTEYDSATPNRYEVEAPLLMATFANLQDWDGVFKYDYVDVQRNYGAEAGVGFFALAGNPVELGIMPVAARIFLEGQTSPAPSETVMRFTPEEVLDSTRVSWGGSMATFLEQEKGVRPPAAFGSRLRIGSFTDRSPRALRAPAPVGPRYVSGGGQLTWDTQDPEAATYLISAPSAKGVMGFIDNQTFNLNGLTLTVGGTPTGASANAEFGAVVLQSLTGRPLLRSEELLLSVVTRFENTGMEWNDDFTSVNDQWGRAPALIEPMRLVATATVADTARAQVWALDPTGAPRTLIPHQVVASRQIEFTVDTARDQTLWYYIVMEEPVDTGISGTVTDNTGAPLSNVLVQTFRQRGTRWVTGARTRTDAAGTYRFDTLVPGPYRIRFARGGFVREFHTDAATLPAATDIIVDPGRLTVVDAELRRR